MPRLRNERHPLLAREQDWRYIHFSNVPARCVTQSKAPTQEEHAAVHNKLHADGRPPFLTSGNTLEEYVADL